MTKIFIFFFCGKLHLPSACSPAWVKAYAHIKKSRRQIRKLWKLDKMDFRTRLSPLIICRETIFRKISLYLERKFYKFRNSSIFAICSLITIQLRKSIIQQNGTKGQKTNFVSLLIINKKILHNLCLTYENGYSLLFIYIHIFSC